MYELTNEQKDFLKAEGNVILCACPGSGKTYVVAKKLLQYIQRWNRSHQGIAVLSFTNVASNEIEKQTKELMPDGFKIDYPHFVGTIDSFINKYILLRFGYLLMPTPRRPTIAIKDLFSVPFRFWRNECHRNRCIDNIHEFRWDMNGTLLRNKEPVKCIGRSYGPPCYQYKKMLLQKGFIFQSEVSGLSYWLLRDHPEIAKAVAARFPIIILDEAQDTSIEQMAILDLINNSGTESMFLVGDPDQSIYEWRNATPECFIEKMSNRDWTTLPLTKNFRSSQLICNATQAFAYTLEGKSPSKAGGLYASYSQKPILLLYEENITDCKSKLIDKFLAFCEKNKISNEPCNIAIVTRSKIHDDTDISGLWKSKEVEIFAQAAYEWFEGTIKKAYELCERALFNLIVKELRDINVSIESDIEESMPYESWRYIVINVLTKLPNVNQPIEMWIAQIKNVLESVLAETDFSITGGRTVNDVIKIKSRDQSVPHFKNIPLRKYFEVKNQSHYTLSSIHGVKGETYNAVMLIVESRTGQTLTPTFLNAGDLNRELMRIAYVAMTRPRKLLVVAMPNIKSRKVHKRFPPDNWDYENI
ncbi:ATP-dependent helicase [Desulforamulus ruminis]|uniref:ATP-dependent helicase n=1 Tax=Desulforamulus ruminis TaxID=1564 RepID=UPI002FDA6486